MKKALFLNSPFNLDIVKLFFTSIITFFLIGQQLLQAQIEVVDPPGTLKMGKDLYIDHVPVSNLMVVEFMVFKEVMKENNFESIQQYLDYRKDFSDQLKIATQYLVDYNTDDFLKDEGYYTEMKNLNHPVLTMTKEMATELCAWRTAMTQHIWLNDLESLYKVQASSRIKYRLPTAKELEQATVIFDDKNDFKMYSNSRIWNLSMQPNKDRFYMFAMYEYTLDDDTYKEHLKSNKEYDYTGFRCVCELE